MIIFIEWIADILIAAGLVIILFGVFGLWRMPDVYTRAHAIALIDSFATPCIAVGLMIKIGATLLALKLLLVVVFICLTGPVATHALLRSALHSGVKPLCGDNKKEQR